jgi:hypothetical protein
MRFPSLLQFSLAPLLSLPELYCTSHLPHSSHLIVAYRQIECGRSVELHARRIITNGENHPVAKTGEACLNTSTNPLLTEQQNIVFVEHWPTRSGPCLGRQGASTEFGKVATELSNVTTRKSPLQLKIDELCRSDWRY